MPAAGRKAKRVCTVAVSKAAPADVESLNRRLLPPSPVPVLFIYSHLSFLFFYIKKK